MKALKSVERLVGLNKENGSERIAAVWFLLQCSAKNTDLVTLNLVTNHNLVTFLGSATRLVFWNIGM